METYKDTCHTAIKMLDDMKDWEGCPVTTMEGDAIELLKAGFLAASHQQTAADTMTMLAKTKALAVHINKRIARAKHDEDTGKYNSTPDTRGQRSVQLRVRFK